MKTHHQNRKLSETERERRTEQRIKNIEAILARFDSMPGSALVRLPVVKALFGVSAPTIYRMVKAGKLAAPERIAARSTGFRVSSVRQALEARHGQ